MHLFHSEVSCAEQGLLQRASPLAKMLLLIVVITFSITRKTAEPLWPVAVMLLALLILSGIRLYKITFLLSVPLITAYLFAAYIMRDTELILARSTVGVLSAMMFFFTTESYDCLALFSPLLPAELADGLYLTYRSIFILGSRVSDALFGLQLRGLIKPFTVATNMGIMAGVLGNILCESLDSAERMGKIMVLRGVSGALGPRSYRLSFSWWDLVPVTCVLFVLGGALWS